jgi:hypothetical protein
MGAGMGRQEYTATKREHLPRNKAYTPSFKKK